jgi:hypothetical protein
MRRGGGGGVRNCLCTQAIQKPLIRAKNVIQELFIQSLCGLAIECSGFLVFFGERKIQEGGCKMQFKKQNQKFFFHRSRYYENLKIEKHFFQILWT